LDFFVVLAGVQRIEIGDAVDAQDDGLAINDKALLPTLQRGLNNSWIALGPIVSAARDQPHAVAIALNAQAKAIVFYLAKPLRAGRDLGARGRDAELKGFEHGFDIGRPGQFCEALSNLCIRLITAETLQGIILDVSMPVPTRHALQRMASLQKKWRRYYLAELARLISAQFFSWIAR
jgi:hypothetical protein